MEEKKTALGIYVLKRNANYRNEDGNKFGRDFLKKGDLVVVIRKKNGFSYIDHYLGYGAESYKVRSSGWIKSSDVGNAISR